MKTILVVDDEPDIRETVQTILEKNKYKVITAVNGDDCLLKLKKEYEGLLKNNAELVSFLEKTRSMTDIRKAREKALQLSKLIEEFWGKVRRLNKKEGIMFEQI